MSPQPAGRPEQAGAASLVRPVKAAVRELLLAARLRRADGFLASFPKSGRTWLRFILANYLNRLHGLGLQLDLRSMFALIPNDVLDPERGVGAYPYRNRDEVPFLVMTHGGADRLLLARRPVLLLLREPKDTLVSYYFHLARRNRDVAQDLDAYLRSDQHGTPALCRYCNDWAEGIGRRPGMLLGYERLRAEPEPAVAAVLEFFGIPVHPGFLDEAIAASSFAAMRRIEVAAGMPGRRYDRSDQESLRVRRGKIGGYADYLQPEQVAYVDRTCASMLTPKAQAMLREVAWTPDPQPAPRQTADAHGG